MEEVEDDFFGDFGICDDNDEDKEVKAPKPQKITFADIAKAIGSFPRWPELAPELKMIVIEHLDFTTRTKLSFCSKSDHEVANSAPLRIYKLEVKDSGEDDFQVSSDPIESISVRVQLRKDYNPNKQLHFIKRGDDTDIGWLKKFKGRAPAAKFRKLKGRNHYEEAVKFVEKLLKLARFSLKSLTVEMENWPCETSTIQYLPQCDDIRLCNKSESSLEWWLRKVRPNLKSLQINSRGSQNPLSMDFLEMDHIKLSNFVHIWSPAVFTEELFMNMTASGFKIDTKSISDQTINQFIKDWVNGKVRENFRSFTIHMGRPAFHREILKDVTFRPWSGDFENETPGFCSDWARVMGRGYCSQIEKGDGSFTSATLDIKFGRITFAVTGTPTQYQGRTVTSYGVPSGI